MLISCPKCHFKRHVDEKQIPESATLATCPKCQNKFRFRDPETGDFIAEICLEMEQEKTEQKTADTPETGTETDAEAVNAEASEIEEKTEPNETAEEKAKEKASLAEDPVPLNEEILKPKNQNDENPLKEPMQGYAEKKAERYVMMTDDVPWEHPERHGFFRSFFRTIARVMLSGKEFFSTIHSQASSLRPASFYAIIGLVQALVGYLSSPSMMNFIQNSNIDPQKQILMENLISRQSLTMLIITTPFIMILQLLVYTAFVYLAIRITNPEKADFPLTLRIIAYASAPMILCIVPYLGGFIGLVWFICNIFIGVKYALRISWQRTFLALAPIFILWFFIAFNQAMMIINAIQG